jgi:hypothetical protein
MNSFPNSDQPHSPSRLGYAFQTGPSNVTCFSPARLIINAVALLTELSSGSFLDLHDVLLADEESDLPLASCDVSVSEVISSPVHHEGEFRLGRWTGETMTSLDQVETGSVAKRGRLKEGEDRLESTS